MKVTAVRRKRLWLGISYLGSLAEGLAKAGKLEEEERNMKNWRRRYRRNENLLVSIIIGEAINQSENISGENRLAVKA